MPRNSYLRRAARTMRRIIRGATRQATRRATPPKPDLSVVVVVYNIPREAPRTLLSLSAEYQRHIGRDEYEVIVVDNGSTPPVDPALIAGLAGRFRLIRIDSASSSPAAAVNRGLSEARGAVMGVMIDGARIASPGLLHFARHGARLYDRAVVAALGWYLGYDYQRFAASAGYNQKREDELLDSVGWPQDGYRLFEIATMDESSVNGWFSPIAESNALFLSRKTWDLLGGMDESFNLPGGGLVNLDTFRRAIELPESALVLLLGEGTFHQVHGGVATNAAAAEMTEKLHVWNRQYQALRGHPYGPADMKRTPTYVGSLPPFALARLTRSALYPLPHQTAPLGRHFDPTLWAMVAPEISSNRVAAALVDLAQCEFRAGRNCAAAGIARLTREHFPDEPEAQRLLSLVAPDLPIDGPPPAARAEHHVALGDAYRILGKNDCAISSYRAALAVDENLVRAHLGLATIRLPGDHCHVWLDRLYTALKPETLIEIGVAEGGLLALARPPTVAIGVDPNPRAMFPLRAATHIFPETSDAFFDKARSKSILGGRPLGMALIDGLHLFERALKDFINLERHCGPRSLILLRGTIPLDERTQRRSCDTQFHTGDVWKTVLCLKQYRADLDIFTIAAPWSGLTIVAGLDATSRVLADRYGEAVARFVDMPFSDPERRIVPLLDIVSNDWNIVEARLKARNIL